MHENNDRRFYVYVYFRLDGSPCYIGKGSGARWLAHERQGEKCHNHRLRSLIVKAKGDLPKLIIRDWLTNDEASEIEMAFIRAIGRSHRGPLVNMTDGGEGTVGNVLSVESRAKIGKKNKGRKRSDVVRARMKEVRTGWKHTEEEKRKIGAAHLGKSTSVEARLKMSVAKKGKPLSPEHAAKVALNFKREKSPEHKAKLRAHCLMLAERRRGMPSNMACSPETRLKMSLAQSGKTLSVEHKAKLSACRLGKPLSAETKLKMSLAQKGKTLSPEHRAKVSALCSARNVARAAARLTVEIGAQ